MKINKFKKTGKNKYKVIFDNSELILYEDVILKYDLLIKNDIDLDLIDKIVEENREYDVYETALNYIEFKMRNKKEVYKYLTNKGFNEELVNNAIKKLENIGLLNNKSYIIAFVNDKVNLSTDGPYKIKKNLMDADFKENEIDEYLNTIPYEVWEEKIKKVINKKKNLMKSKSYYMFINKMKNDLYNMGYDKDLIEKELSNINYESNALEKDYEKCNKKFKGDKTKIINSLLRKGYSYEDINLMLK